MSSKSPSDDGATTASRSAKSFTSARSRSRYLQPTASTSQKASPALSHAPRNTAARKPSASVTAPTKPEPSFARPTSASVARVPTASFSSASSSHRLASSRNGPAPGSEKQTRTARSGSATGMGGPEMRTDPKKPLSKSVVNGPREREHRAPAGMARSTSQSTKPALPPLPARTRGPAAPDSLQIAAQFNAWAYLQSSLQSTFVSAQSSVEAELDTLSRELDAEEFNVRDVRMRSQAESALALLDKLTENDSHGRVATLLRDYFLQQKAWINMETSALDLVDRASTRKPVSREECERCLDRISLAISNTEAAFSELGKCVLDSGPSLTPLAPLRQVLTERILTMGMAKDLVSSVSHIIQTLARIEQLSLPRVASVA